MGGDWTSRCLGTSQAQADSNEKGARTSSCRKGEWFDQRAASIRTHGPFEERADNPQRQCNQKTASQTASVRYGDTIGYGAVFIKSDLITQYSASYIGMMRIPEEKPDRQEILLPHSENVPGCSIKYGAPIGSRLQCLDYCADAACTAHCSIQRIDYLQCALRA